MIHQLIYVELSLRLFHLFLRALERLRTHGQMQMLTVVSYYITMVSKNLITIQLFLLFPELQVVWLIQFGLELQVHNRYKIMKLMYNKLQASQLKDQDQLLLNGLSIILKRTKELLSMINLLKIQNSSMRKHYKK